MEEVVDTIKHAGEAWAAMDSVLSEIYDLQEDELYAPKGPDTNTTTGQRESSICTAIYNLGNAVTGDGQLPPQHGAVRGGCKLGSGRYGVVVKARDSETGETVALKTLHPKSIYGDESMVEEEDEPSTCRILREACFMAACRGHPSLVNLSSVGRDPRTGKYCLVMEHVGPCLDDVLNNKPFPEREVRRMMRQVLSGAKAMHDRGVVHRAINSTNIFLADGGEKDVVKIGDFGEARSMTFDSNAGFTTRMSHVAPECLLEKPGACENEAMDSWSMGCLMLELLTGEDNLSVVNNNVKTQLHMIDDVLGRLSCKRTSRRNKAGKRKQQQGSRLRGLVPRDVLSDDGFQVLQGLLQYNPEARLTAADALRLPWFANDMDMDDDDDDDQVMRLIGVVALLLLMVFVCLLRLY